MSKHTPGPWLTREVVSGHYQVAQDDTGQTIASILSASGIGKHNARLIASAPDLLAALEKARAWVAVYENMPGHDAAARSMLLCIDAALSKAKGE